MKNVLYILVCLGMTSMASALSINNGDFEDQSGTADAADVRDWYDYGNANYQAGPWFRGDGAGTINTTGCLFMSGSAADTSEDGGHKAYVYQSIGNADGTQAIDISLQWGAASYVVDRNTGDGEGGIMGLTVMILESDGTFVPGDDKWGRINDIYGAGGVTEITRTTIVRDLAPGVAVDEVFTLNISGATEGRELFIRINAYNAGDVEPWMSIDNITIAANRIVPKSPKDDARFVAVERTSSGNDLVFTIADPNGDITAVDILFGPQNDPNLSLNPAYKIVSGKPVSQGNQYTITLNTELSADLLNDTQYYWKILAYEPNGMGEPQLASTTSVWSFKTVQVGPYLGTVDPNTNGVFAGQDAVFTVFSVKANTFQWYKQGTPNIALSASDPSYSGVNTNTLTVNNAQLDDEGFYYCVATETTSGLSATSEASGQLVIKRLMHHFQFNTEDVTGNITPDTIGGVQAQLMGGATVVSDSNSIVGGFLRLDNPGTNAQDTQYANILNASMFDQRQITVSAWYRMATRSGKQPIWACGADTNNYFDFYPQYQYNEDGLDSARSEFRVSSNLRNLTGAYEINTDQWYFVSVTNNDGTVRLYLDGVYVGISDMFTMPELTKTIAYIGRRIAGVAGDYPMFDGSIDELKVYNYAMSSVEVGQAYLGVKTDVEFVCNEDIYDLATWDLDSNCRVDLADFAVIAARWLEDHRILQN
jgi:hypothetical protein